MLTHVIAWTAAQLGWVIMALTSFNTFTSLLWFIPLYLLELGGPLLAERNGGLPWHAEHLAERYGLLTIISLGEGVVGTMGALAVLVSHGWSGDAVALLACAIAVALWLASEFALYGLMLRSSAAHDAFHAALFGACMAPLVVRVLVTRATDSMTLGFLITALAPVVAVIGFETVGTRHLAEEMDNLTS